MFVHHDANWPQAGKDRFDAQQGEVAGLAGAERDLLWCLRRLALMQPLGSGRDGHVHLLLQRRYGDNGLAAEHLLRCLLVGLAHRALRKVALQRPCCLDCSDDERQLLRAIRRAAHPQRAEQALAAMAGPRAAELTPYLASLRMLTTSARQP